MDDRLQRTRLLIPLGLALIGVIGGFVMARVVDPGSATAETQSETLLEQPLSALRADTKLKDELEEEYHKVAAATDSESLRALWEPIAEDPSVEAYVVREMIIARWAEVDPEGGFDFFLKNWTVFQKLAAEWAFNDPHAACAKMVESKRSSSIQTIAKALARRSPERCLELLEIYLETSGHRPTMASGATRDAFARLFAQDRDKALAALEDLPAERRVAAINGLAEAMVETDLPAAQKWAESLTDPGERLAVIAEVAAELGKRDPDAAIPLLAELEKPFTWGKPGMIVVRELIKEDPSAAIAWLGRHFPAESHESGCASSVLYHLFEIAGDAETIRAIANTADETFRAGLIDALDTSSAASRTTEMLELIDRQVVSPELRAQFRKPLMKRMVNMDLPAAVEYIRSLPATEVTAELWEQLFEEGSDYGFEGNAALFWDVIDELPPEKQTEYLEPRLTSLALSNPEEAHTRLAEFRDHPGYVLMVENMASAMRFSDPERAKAWISTLDGGLRGRAARDFASGGPPESLPEMFEWMQSLGVAERHQVTLAAWEIHKWAAADGTAVSEFIRTLGPGALRQQAIIRLVAGIYQLDPGATFEWIDEISDPEERARLRELTEQEYLRTRRIGDG